jgi:lipopolysaccharide/colanic/teichoic acid biosynthesis glycosyltransferase
VRRWPNLNKLIQSHCGRRPRALQSRPGITGLAQINGRNHLTPRKKVSYDVAYARLWSWQMEARIIYGTIRYVLTGHGIL